MEKKTIGKLISVLRRAHGMTQRELGEKLFVSDKTVSRWECDECTPELSLIPVIADLFGVSTDELLRGECNNRVDDATNDAQGETQREYQRRQNDKLMRRILHQKNVRYKNQSMISVGIAIVGLIAAMICNLVFYRGILGFCIACVFYLAGIICQCCFVSSARYHAYDEEDHTYDAMIWRANAALGRIALWVICAILVLASFTLPIAILTDGAYTGLAFGSWLLAGSLFAVLAVIIIHVVYVLGVRASLLRTGFLAADEQQTKYFAVQRRVLVRMSVIAVAIGAVLLIAAWVVTQFGQEVIVTPIEFDNYADFVDYMEAAVAADSTGENANAVIPDSTVEQVRPPHMDTVTDADGNILCEYPWSTAVSSIRFSFDTSADGLPVFVYTRQEVRLSREMANSIATWIVLTCVAQVVICAAIYTVHCARWKKKLLTK